MQNTIALVGGAIVMLGLASVAGWLAGSMSHDTPGVAPGRSDGAAAGRLEFDELDRRLNRLETMLESTDENAAAALQAVSDLREDVETLIGQARPAVAQDSVVINPRAPDSTARTPEERAADFRERARKIYADGATLVLRGHLALLGDTSEGADDRRRSQVHAEAQRFAVAYAVKSTHRDTVTEILSDWMSQSVRDVGPYMRAGLERADLPRIEQAIVPVWDARDERLRKVLSDEAWKDYHADQKFYREHMLKAFEQLGKSGNSGKSE